MTLTMNRVINYTAIITCFALCLIIASCDTVEAKKYYVSNTEGKDTNNGESESSPWKTIDQLNDHPFSAGDEIFFKRGDTWRATTLRIKQSSLYFGAYGSGEKPKLLGSIQLSDWVKSGTNNIWKSNTLVENPRDVGTYGSEIFTMEIGDTIAHFGNFEDYNDGFRNLEEEYDWTFNDGAVYVLSDSDPGTKYEYIEAPQKAYGIVVEHETDYITIEGLFIGFLVNTGIRDSYPPEPAEVLNIKSCEIAYIGYRNSKQAWGTATWHSNSTISNNEIHDCGSRGISINMWDAGSETVILRNVVIENNHFYNGWHTTGVDCINFSDKHSVDSITIRNNYFMGTPDLISLNNEPNSNMIYLSDQSGDDKTGTKNFYIYNNVFTHTHGKFIGMGRTHGINIYNNTFYGIHPELDNYQAMVFAAGNYNTEITIMNNIFYNNKDGGNIWNVHLDADALDEVTMDYNLFYGTESSSRMLSIDGSSQYWVNNWGTMAADHPQFVANNPAIADPKFMNPPEDLRLESTSPAVSAAMPIPWITTDKNGIIRSSQSPDIGAFENDELPSETSLSNVENMLSSVYPNPASESFTLKMVDGFMGTYLVQIFDLQGKRIFQSETQNEKELLVSTKGFSAGVYLVNLISNNVSIGRKKLTIQ